MTFVDYCTGFAFSGELVFPHYSASKVRKFETMFIQNRTTLIVTSIFGYSALLCSILSRIKVLFLP